MTEGGNNVSHAHNVLPEKLKNHGYAEKYQYIDFDEELGK